MQEEINELSIERAKLNDLEHVYAIILTRSRWLKQRSILQWDPPYPKKRFENEIRAGEVYYVQDATCIIGTVTLLIRASTILFGRSLGRCEKGLLCLPFSDYAQLRRQELRRKDT
jgi:hypothetical protein